MTKASTLDRPAAAAEVKAAQYDPVLAHDTAHGRMYSRTVGGAPVVPSITNILGVEDSGDVLRNWYGKQAVIEAWDHPRLADAAGGDQRARWAIEKAVKDAGARRAEEAAERGSRVHFYAEQKARHQLGAATPSDVRAAYDTLAAHGETAWAVSLDEWWTAWQVTPIFPEATLWNEVDGYAGTTDLYCSINGVLALIDYKNKIHDPNGRFGPPTPKPQVEQQLHAAAFATERHVEAEGRWVQVSLRPQLLIAAMVTDNGVFPYTVAGMNDPRPFLKFQTLRQLWQDRCDETTSGEPKFRPLVPPPSVRGLSGGQ